MVNNLQDNELVRVFNYNTNLLEIWLNQGLYNNYEKIIFINKLGAGCDTRENFNYFKNIIIRNLGYIEGIDHCYNPKDSSEFNDQILVDSANVEIKFEYVKIDGLPLSTAEICLKTKSKTNSKGTVFLESCKINDLKCSNFYMEYTNGRCLKHYSFDGQNETSNHIHINSDFFSKEIFTKLEGFI